MAKSCLVRLWRADASFRPRWQDIVLGHVSTLTKAQRTPRPLSAWWRAVWPRQLPHPNDCRKRRHPRMRSTAAASGGKSAWAGV